RVCVKSGNLSDPELHIICSRVNALNVVLKCTRFHKQIELDTVVCRLRHNINFGSVTHTAPRPADLKFLIVAKRPDDERKILNRSVCAEHFECRNVPIADTASSAIGL